MPSFLSLFQSIYSRDPRPTRFARLLRTFGDVTICALGSENEARLDGMGFIPLASRPKTVPAQIFRAGSLLARLYERDIWNPSLQAAFAALGNTPYACIVCHDLELLPLACALREKTHNKTRCKIIMDAREFYPRQFEDRMAWRLLLGGVNDYLCKRYMPQADLVFTVSPGLRQGYAEQYGVQCTVLPSYSPYAKMEPHATPASAVRCVHHGGAMPGRRLEMMIEAVRLLDGRFCLDFMLAPTTPGYLDALKQRAAGIPSISFRDPVPMADIVPNIAAYDVGVYLLPPSNFNHRHALPNKLFECIQARLAVAIGPSPDMASLVKEHGIGVVSEDFTPQSFADILSRLRPEDIDRFKANSHAAAESLCWERNDEAVARILHGLLA
ncbi:MAG: hypothetical protein FWH34_01510 [Desulfovibrionaceae bacterium]|nr:hypothetical protein [Desulfovibrionaceae bacterium]